jgi:hypothetical protein
MKALVERNVIWATANPCAQDVTAHGWDDAVAHAQDAATFPRSQRVAAAARAPTAHAEVTHADDTVVAAHAQGIDTEVGATAADRDRAASAADRGQDVACAEAAADVDRANNRNLRRRCCSTHHCRRLCTMRYCRHQRASRRRLRPRVGCRRCLRHACCCCHPRASRCHLCWQP